LSWNLATRLTAGEYYFGFQFSTNSTSSIGLSTTALRATISMMVGAAAPAGLTPIFGEIGVNGTNQTIMQPSPMEGVNSVMLTATNQTHQASQVSFTNRKWIGPILRNFN
jgi:hypothetical protein